MSDNAHVNFTDYLLCVKLYLAWL